ncbi:MAG TPA: hypothetical protein VE623_02200, partial [Acidimicrobiales bacterium]|nr:hypothetical protein [Acidimicrobiales bacterium]
EPALYNSATVTVSRDSAAADTPAVGWPRDTGQQLGGQGIAVRLGDRTPSGCRSKLGHLACRT